MSDNEGAKTYNEMRAWDAARRVKLALYDLIDDARFDRAERLRGQIREAAASGAGQIAEGYGRFDPRDHARYLKMAKASLIECQNHLVDAVDRKLITEAVRREHDLMIQEVLNGLGSLISYLQSDQAGRNVERIKRQRAAKRARRANDEP